MIRLSPIYGTGGNKPKFIWNFFEKAKKNLPIYTHKYKNGSPILDLLNIKDAARAIELIVEKKVYKTIHIGSGVGYSTFEIAQRIKKICQSESKISLQKINDYNTNIIMDISRAKKILNWSPKVDINDGLMDIFSKKYES